MKKKILIIGPTEFKGGIESFTLRLVLQLSKNFDFSILQFRPVEIVNHRLYTQKLNIPIYKAIIPNGILGKIKRKSIAKKFFKEHHFDIVHINTNSPDSYFWAEAALLGGSKVIYQSHNGAAETLNGKRIPKSLMKFLRYSQRKKLLKLDTCNIQVSDIAGKWMFGNQYDKKQTFVNGINLIEFTFSGVKRKLIRKQYGIKKNENIVLIASRMVAQKNIFRSLAICSGGVRSGIIDNVFFLGEGNESESLKKELSKLPDPLQKRIKYLGVQDDMQGWYSAADLLLMPSLFEGLPYSVIEAQATGLPVLMSDSVTQEVAITDLVNYISLSRNDNKWIEEIKGLLALNRSRTSYNHQLARSDFSIKKFHENFLKLYTEI